ncbi:hypothetical protein GPECTOR_1g228 [Gonium pectorale]|uniref:Thioredoxin domain-containing protein n=1 Tax=Gonium pectorale TaxID=33097 RepID=A0A150H2F7_GONPE|nr:hypothetical protein GPECTOR_1g228 [Gonium pectorale]|eukprot:KXZ56261.1 hypothetical protein GPECTOR_1g228 [Gonium pectorale]
MGSGGQRETERPGVGSLKKSLRRLDGSSPLSSTVSELRALDSRLSSIASLPRVLYGTARSASAGALLGSTLGSLPEDYGKPELSQTQQKLASTMRASEQRPRYKAKRVKLPWMRLKDVDGQVVGPGAPSDTLVVLCVLADWNPVCARVEAALEAAHGGFCEEQQQRSGSEAARIKMYKLDASEGNTLQDRYGFRTVPMLLMFFEGRLVAATNAVRGEGQAREAALAALVRGRKRDFLPEGFRFAAGADNTLLEYIRPHTVLREL